MSEMVAAQGALQILFQSLQQRSNELLVVSPALDRGFVHFPADLNVAGGVDGSAALVEIQTIGMPLQAQKINHPAAGFLLPVD